MNAFTKDIVRTIRHTKKRFISIAAITALGATMLTGLSMACLDLREAADALYARQDLFDISVQSTYGLTQEETAKSVNKSRPAVANALRLLHLPDTIAQMVAGGELSAGHARALLAFATEEEQLDAAAAAVDKSLSVRDLERMAKASRAPRKEKEAPALFSRPPFFEEVELSLTEHMGRRVKVTPLKAGDKSGGTLTIEFFDSGDLQDLAARLAPES